MPTCGGGSCCSCKKLPVTMAIEGALRQAALWTQPGSNTGRNLQPRRHRLEEEGFSLPLRPLARLLKMKNADADQWQISPPAPSDKQIRPLLRPVPMSPPPPSERKPEPLLRPVPSRPAAPSCRESEQLCG